MPEREWCSVARGKVVIELSPGSSEVIVKDSSSGFITLAFGRRFAEMAVDLALSLREFHAEPISIAVDRTALKHLERYQPSPFDRIIELPQHVHPWGAKFLVADASPYEHSAYIDADILFLGPSNFLTYKFTAPLAMYGAYMSPEKDYKTYFPPREICADFGLSRYFWATSGIFLFRKSEASELFQQCYDFYTAGIKKYPARYSQGVVPDEMVFGIMSDRYTIDSIPCPTVHPWPMSEHLPTILPSDRKWPTFHMFSSPNEAYMQFLMDGLNRRRRVAGFELVSESIWRDKACSVPTMWEKLKHIHRRIWRKFKKFRSA
jgi:hypothetical protein